MTKAAPVPVPASAGAAAHTFVADVDRPVLAEDDRRHLERVLRLRPGQPVTVADGHGRWRLCRFGPDLEPDGDVVATPAPAPGLTVGFAVVKGDRPEWAVQKLTELGIDRIIPLAAARSVVRWDAARAERNHRRLEAVARAAAMQSRRAWLADVAPLTAFADAASIPGAARADVGGGPPSLACPAVLVGPEGGWSPAESSLPLPIVGLGDTVLRTETAAVAFGALLAALRSGAVGPVA